MTDHSAGDLTGTSADHQQFYGIEMGTVFFQQGGDSLFSLRKYLFGRDAP